MTYPTYTRSLKFLLVIGLLGLSIVGCQSFQPKNPGEQALKNHDFIGLWDAYNDCRTGSNAQDITKKLEFLQTAPTPISLDDSPIPIPQFIKKLTSTRNSRLAVDPRAMAASCAMHLAQVAHQSADWETSLLAWQSIVSQYPEAQYAFYVSEASRAIEEFSSVRPVSLHSQDSFVR